MQQIIASNFYSVCCLKCLTVLSSWSQQFKSLATLYTGGLIFFLGYLPGREVPALQGPYAEARNHTCYEDLLQLRWLVTKYSLIGPEFYPMPVSVVFVVYKVALGQVLLTAIRFTPDSYSTSALYSSVIRY